MTFWSYLLEILTIIYLYLFIYNISLMIFFWNFQQFSSFFFKSIYSFSSFKFSFYFTISLLITLFSIAGVPPFTGFFTKLLILISVSNSNFFFFYLLFFSLLFIGLYFYIQNIRFLLSSKNDNLNYSFEKIIRTASIYFIISFFIIFFLSIGFIFFDDFYFYFYWIFK